MSDLTSTVDTYLAAWNEEDHRFRRVSGVDARHAHLRFAWELVAPDGSVAMSGLDVGELAADGKLRRIVGFFGDLPTS